MWTSTITILKLCMSIGLCRDLDYVTYHPSCLLPWWNGHASWPRWKTNMGPDELFTWSSVSDGFFRSWRLGSSSSYVYIYKNLSQDNILLKASQPLNDTALANRVRNQTTPRSPPPKPSSSANTLLSPRTSWYFILPSWTLLNASIRCSIQSNLNFHRLDT